MPSTYANIVLHVVFATKGRAQLIENEWRDRLHAYIGGAVKGLGGFVLAVGGTADHIHIAIALRPTHCIADFMRELKKSSSSWVHEELSRLAFAWQEGYGVFSVDAKGVPALREYIATQEEHHRHVDSKTEFLSLCREAGIEVDMRYFE